MKTIFDYLHLYIGSEVEYKRQDEGAEELRTVRTKLTITTLLMLHEIGGHPDGWVSDIKLILRSTETLTDDELREIFRLEWELMPYKIGRINFRKDEPKRVLKHAGGYGYSAFDENGKHIVTGTLSMNRFYPTQLNYLRSIGVDCDRLLESGLAV